MADQAPLAVLSADKKQRRRRFQTKRNDFLKEGDWFYNYQLIKSFLSRNITNLATIMNEKNIVVYGELFGGWYPENTLVQVISERLGFVNQFLLPGTR